jgi:hypothetical protein
MTNFILIIILLAFVIFAVWMVKTKSIPPKVQFWTLFSGVIGGLTFVHNILWPDIYNFVLKRLPDILPEFVDEIIDGIRSFFQ